MTDLKTLTPVATLSEVEWIDDSGVPDRSKIAPAVWDFLRAMHEKLGPDVLKRCTLASNVSLIDTGARKTLQGVTYELAADAPTADVLSFLGPFYQSFSVFRLPFTAHDRDAGAVQAAVKQSLSGIHQPTDAWGGPYPQQFGVYASAVDGRLYARVTCGRGELHESLCKAVVESAATGTISRLADLIRLPYRPPVMSPVQAAIEQIPEMNAAYASTLGTQFSRLLASLPATTTTTTTTTNNKKLNPTTDGASIRSFNPVLEQSGFFNTIGGSQTPGCVCISQGLWYRAGGVLRQDGFVAQRTVAPRPSSMRDTLAELGDGIEPKREHVYLQESPLILRRLNISTEVYNELSGLPISTGSKRLPPGYVNSDLVEQRHKIWLSSSDQLHPALVSTYGSYDGAFKRCLEKHVGSFSDVGDEKLDLIAQSWSSIAIQSLTLDEAVALGAALPADSRVGLELASPAVKSAFSAYVRLTNAAARNGLATRVLPDLFRQDPTTPCLMQIPYDFLRVAVDAKQQITAAGLTREAPKKNERSAAT